MLCTNAQFFQNYQTHRSHIYKPERLRYATTVIYIIAVERFPSISNAMCASTIKLSMRKGQNPPMPQVLKKKTPLSLKFKSRYLSIVALRIRPVLLRAGARRPTTAAVLPRSAWSSLRARLPASAVFSGIAWTSVVVAGASVGCNTTAHALSPCTGSECVHHQVRLTDSAACSATAESTVAGQPRTSRRCDGILQGRGKVPVWLDATLNAPL